MAVVEIRGSGNKSFVFVHGMPSDRTVWYDLAELAPSDAAVVLVDLPDHGEAPDDPSATFEALERAVLEAVAEAPGDEVTVVGHSVGAWLVAALSSTLPERVRRFVAICGMARYDDDGLAMRRSLAEQLESGAIAVDTVREMLLGLLFGEERRPELEARMAPMLDLSREHWIRLARRSLLINERPPAYFERPATVIHATGDAGIPLALGEDLARRSGVELVPIETSSHMVQMTHAAELARLIYPPARAGR